VLDADMPADIIGTLKRLKFEDYLIGVDAVMRDFLVSAVSPCAEIATMLALKDRQLATREGRAVG
jgi:hypothetical protein